LYLSVRIFEIGYERRYLYIVNHV